jgi:hypothetical protein
MKDPQLAIFPARRFAEGWEQSGFGGSFSALRKSQKENIDCLN